MRFVPLNCVPDGAYLAKTLYDQEGRILLSQGTKLNDNLINKIQRSGFNTIYIQDEFSDNEIEEIITPELKLRAVDRIKQIFGRINEKNTKREKINLLDDKAITSLKDISNSIVDELFTSKHIVINLVDIKNLDNYTYEHSLNVAILSLILGFELNLNRNELYNLSLGALLHDIGKAFIPKEIVKKQDSLTDEEFEIIKSHPIKGFNYLKEQFQLTAPSKIIALQHHERFDGTGYPYGKKGDEINKLARIVAIADVYDAMTSDRPYKKAQPPSEALEYIMGSAGRHFDFQMVSAFVKKIIPYPIGTLVRLSNGKIAIVEEINPNFPLRPKVKIIEQRATTVEMTSLNLLNEKNIVIEGIQYELPNPSVQSYLKKK